MGEGGMSVIPAKAGIHPVPSPDFGGGVQCTESSPLERAWNSSPAFTS